jgi:hypothetical protein
MSIEEKCDAVPEQVNIHREQQGALHRSLPRSIRRELPPAAGATGRFGTLGRASHVRCYPVPSATISRVPSHRCGPDQRVVDSQ